MLKGDPSAEYRPLTIDPRSLQHLIRVAGFDEHIITMFFRSRLCSFSFYLQYGDRTDKPEFMTVLLRCPRNSRCLMGCIRLQFSSRSCLVLLNSVHSEDGMKVWEQCRANTDLLRSHPLYILAFIYEHRLDTWMGWSSTLWNQVAGVEKTTGTTSPAWARPTQDDPLINLSKPDTLVKRIHAAHVELSHTDTIVSYGIKFGNFCLELVTEAERRRRDLQRTVLPMSCMSALEGRLKFILSQCEPLLSKDSELRSRALGQIQVAFHLNAEKNSRINLAVAQQQARDSQTVKTIAVLGLIFLPSTLVTALWTSGLFHLEGDRNWQIYLIVSLLLTLVVILCWRLYVMISGGRKASQMLGSCSCGYVV
ncbi:hypothetical protein BJY01DRAFT_221221 [Aspergillus pseudoustus]|uniref:Cora-like Mg2+ transporter protein-domain-containing protein n=1 Tax=Aspergillus pseudoustus TaxID=1810923 RepID=A0ABR4JAT3_9EURO